MPVPSRSWWRAPIRSSKPARPFASWPAVTPTARSSSFPEPAGDDRARIDQVSAETDEKGNWWERFGGAFSMTSDEETPEGLLRRAYRLFNERRIDALLELMTEGVEWPNVASGTVLHGREAIRPYWEAQFAAA